MKSLAFGRRCASLAYVLSFSAISAFGQQSPKSDIVVTVRHARLVRSAIRFDWQLVNVSNEPIYVYATFLEGPAAMSPTVQIGHIEIRTSLNTQTSVGVNAYPPAKFIRLEPGKPLTGAFSEHDVDRKLVRGAIAVQMEVAYGRDVEALKQEIVTASRNGDHPANPIVAWQTEAQGEAHLSR